MFHGNAHVTGKEVIKLLIKAGWKHTNTRGSHYKMEKRGCRPVPVPVHGNKDLGIGLLKTIEKQTGVKLYE
jgi:predicted RNA binding protein YcfA (HicA-like mRNA interferase family)